MADPATLATSIRGVSEPGKENDVPLERTIAIVAGVLIVAMLLIWRYA